MTTANNDTSRPAKLEDNRPLADSELDAVSGGSYFPGNTKYTAVKLPR
jgi:hypothetical protein